MGVGGKVLPAVCQHRTHGSEGSAVQIHDAKVSQAGLQKDHPGNHQNRPGDNGTQRIGENVPEHNAGILCPQNPGRLDIFSVLIAVKLHPGNVGNPQPTCQHKGK